MPAPEGDEVRRGPVPDWVIPLEPLPVPADASGMTFVRQSDSLVHLDADGQANFFASRIKILHPNALAAGNIGISWNPAGGSATIHYLRVHRDGQVIDVLDNSRFEILRREDQLEAASLNGVLTATLRVPDLRVGDELEIAFTLRHLDPTLGANEAGAHIYLPELQPGRYRFGLDWAEGHAPTVRMTPNLEGVAKRSARSISWQLDNPSPVHPPQMAPPRYHWTRAIEYSDFADWGRISSKFAGLYAAASTLEPGSPLKAEAARIAAAHSDPMGRAAAALKLVQQEVRYIYVGLDGGNLTPATAEQTWQRRYGDCKGKTALLLALLRELGIEAHAVLANNQGADDGLDQRLPNPGMFDHVLVRARIGGELYWLDGTLPPVAVPSREALIPYRWVLPLDAHGSSIERQAWRPAATPSEVALFEIDARKGFDQPARMVLTYIIRGLPALAQQTLLSALTPAQLLSAMRQDMVGDALQSVDEASYRFDPEKQAGILTVTGSGTADWDDLGDGTRRLILPGGGFNPPERRIRPPEQDQNAPFYNNPVYACHVTTVRLPTTTEARHWSHNSAISTRMFGQVYYRTFDISDGALRMIRGTRVEQPEIDTARAARDNRRIAGFDNSTAMLVHHPSLAIPERQSRGPVPATYEIDWTANDIPCLPQRSRPAGDAAAAPQVAPGGRARAWGSLLQLISSDDYPIAALRANEQGTVRARLSVDETGAVTDCVVTHSSGSSSLDETTCAIFLDRAQFSPARDAEGRPIPDTVNTPPIRWQMMEAVEMPPAAE